MPPRENQGTAAEAEAGTARSKGGEGGSALHMAGTMLAYAVANSQMLLVNKLCMTHFDSATFVITTQLAFTAGLIYLLGKLKLIEVDGLELGKAMRFLPAAVVFVGLLVTSMLAIKRVPVDTFICTRNSVPLIIAFLEYALLGRQFPSVRSLFAMALVLIGVALYVRLDVNFDNEGYLMLLLWYAFCLADLLYLKVVVDTLDMTTWGRSFYFNLLSVPFSAALFVAKNDVEMMRKQYWGVWPIVWLAASCVISVGMSYYSFFLRKMVSATTFSLVGNVCKVITIFANFFFLPDHASEKGLAALLVSLVGAMLYKQAPLRSPAASPALPK